MVSHKVGHTDVQNKIAANNAERFVQRELMSLGVSSELCGGSSEHDLLVNGGISLEVKSARAIGRRLGEGYKHLVGRGGRFDIPNRTQREKLNESNRWVCFVIYAARKHRILGFLRGEKVIVTRRHITLASLLDENGLINEEEFVGLITKG